jgi:cell division protein FtsL
MRIVNIFFFTSLIALSFVIYEVKNETRSMNDRVSALKLDIRKERDAIAVLRAEWSHLNRPERIERLARKHLGLKPVGVRQMLTPEQLAAARIGQSETTAALPRPKASTPSLRHPVKAVR